MFSLFNQYENPVAVTIQLLKKLHVKITRATIAESIVSHPDYPSILSISDALNSWHVDNAVIGIEPEKLKELPLPFIAFIKTNGGAFVAVTNIDNNNIFYLSGTSSEHSKPLTSFIKDFTGFVLLAQANETSGQSGYHEAKRKETIQQLKVPLVILTGIILIAFAVSNQFASSSFLSYIVLLILKFSGLLVSCLLLWYETDKTNAALQRICSGRKTYCNAVLNSKASKIWGISWSEIGFFYFAGGFLLLLLTAGNYSSTAGLQLVQFINLLALPYTFFSVYYQWRIVKKWCPLCLAIQTILLFEFVAGSVFKPLSFNMFKSFNLSILSTATTSFVLPVITWLISKPLLYKQQKAKQDFRSLQRIKFNKDIFKMLLEKQKHISEPTESLGITLGNKDATNTLIKVCNPYCGPCARAHAEIEKLLEENDNLKVQIIFTTTNKEDDIKIFPVKHLLAIAEKNNETLTKIALDDWYMAGKKDYTTFANKYPMNGELKMQDKKIDIMKEWCEKAEIKATPTIFYNGYQLPDVYNIGDLQYFLVE